MTKKLSIFLFFFLVLLLSPIYGSAADAQLGIQVENKETGAGAVVSEGRLLLPLRTVCEKSGYEVKWSSKDKTVTIKGKDKHVRIFVNSSMVDVNGHQILLPEIFKSVNGELHLPASFFSDNLSLGVRWDKAANRVLVSRITENAIRVSSHREASETDKLKMTLQYPVLHGLKDPQVEKNLNSMFRDIAKDAGCEGTKIAGCMSEDSIKRGIKAEIYLDYQVKYNQHGLLSLVFSNYQYSGGAHGLTVQNSYTFDLETGTDLKLKDFFIDHEDYVKKISDQVSKQMKDKGMTVFLNPFKAIREDQDFYLGNQSLVIYFQEYEYFAYAYGIPEFPIEFGVLENSLREEFGFLKVTG